MQVIKIFLCIYLCNVIITILIRYLHIDTFARNSSKENGIMKGKFSGKSWLNSFLNRWFMYLYPFLLIFTEAVLRAADKAGVMTLETTSFIGPSLAAVGAAFVVPLTARRPMTQEKLEKLKKRS